MSQISPPRPSRSNPVQRRLPWLYAFWKFSRPHTIIGTTLSVLGIYGIVLSLNPASLSLPSFLSLVLLPLFTCLCGNVYIVGLNQLEDVAIDKINKPHLPLASGEFSRREGQAIVLITGLLALILSAVQGVFLMAMVWLSLAIGTAYSLPPIRLKRFPFWASVCIFTVRGAIVNLGLFLHMNQKLGGSFGIPAPVWVLTLFVLVFTFAIAIFKDIPDLEGDRLYHITTFTMRLGQKAVFNLARWVITICYGGMIVAAPFLAGVNTGFLIVTQSIALMSLWVLSYRVDLREKESIARFYQFIWKLFFLEYLVFPAACLMHQG
ncbi:homogentisate phytyltransferase [Leptolyngbya ohadii]|uniref:homogentisate phytyltransferase n=1 Tax=Leptolyngbya ohadii TaxID=1962290 RepID=UPI000B59DFE2|nr:homogentisate phytyltransferase [Leptolyngbya ohadii]